MNIEFPKRRSLNGLIAAAFTVVGVSAAAPEPTDADGIFDDETPAGAGTPAGPTFFWGTPEPSVFDYMAPSGITADGSGWDIGEFTYLNGASSAGSGATSVKLYLDINFDGNPIPQTFPFLLNIVNSDNVTPDEADDATENDGVDLGDIQEAANASRDTVQINGPLPFTIGDYILTLSFKPVRGIDEFNNENGDPVPDGIDDQLDPDTGLYSGISADGSQFSVLEGKSASARVIATITSSSQPNVPDGGSTLALLGSAVASLGVLRRIRR